MNILIDCTNLKAGGGIQVAISFINDLKTITSEDKYFIILSHEMKNNINQNEFSLRFWFYSLTPQDSNKFKINRILKKIELEKEIDRIFCVFGPSYYKSNKPKIVGYALPHFLYSSSPFFKMINLSTKLRLKLMELIQINSFKRNSDKLIFETEDARNRFCNKFQFKRKNTFVVSNTINEVFLDKKRWRSLKLEKVVGVKILCIGAYYPHKNFEIIPKVIKCLNDKGYEDFTFYVTLPKSDIKIDENYNKYIFYLGKVELEKLPSLYAQMDIVFMPSLLEVFSATYIEAMHMNIPLIASDLGFARDICRDAALYFNPENAEDAATKIQQLMKEKELRKQLINKGKENLKRFGTSKDRTEAYLNIIHQ